MKFLILLYINFHNSYFVYFTYFVYSAGVVGRHVEIWAKLFSFVRTKEHLPGVRTKERILGVRIRMPKSSECWRLLWYRGNRGAHHVEDFR